MVFLALKKVRFSPPDEKVPPFTKIFNSPAGRGDFPHTPLMLFGKLWHVSPLITRCRNNFHIFLSL